MKSTKSRVFTYMLILTLIFSLSIPGLAAGAEPSKGEKKKSQKIEADIIYYNGDIVTVDKNMSSAEAVAVVGNEIVAVGKMGDIMPLSGKNTKKINLQGKTMLPGFYDAHSHFLSTGISLLTSVQLQSPPIGTIKNMDQLLAALSERAKTIKPGEWIIGRGYDDGGLEEGRHPTREDLDKVSTEIPIVITHFSGHNSVVNSKALEIGGITKDTPNPSGSEIGHFADGSPNGQLWELNAMKMVSDHIPPVTQQQRLEAIALVSDIYAAKGVTTANDGAGSDFELFKKALDNNYLKIRSTLWFGSVDAAKKAYDQFGGKEVRGKNQYYKDLVVLNGVKYFQDGSPQLRTAHLTDPYFTTGEYPEDWVAYPTYTQEELNEKIIETHQAGFNQIYVHTNGDAAIDALINAYEEVRKPEYRQPAKPSDLRHTLIHTQFSREDQFDRMKDLGLIPSFLMHHAYYLGDRHMAEYFGPERSYRMSATKDAANRDLPFTLHCDTPVFPQDPLHIMWGAVNRLSFTGQEIFTENYKEGTKYRSVDQRITPEQALRGITINAAYQDAEENITGSIEVGKRADFVILAENPLKVDKMHIKDIKVLETIVGGKTVFKDDSKNKDKDKKQK
ncbi:hypothetical protein SAMN00017405_0541 [Desulfonispora thiosulfatigenes DSM 11270]|uniref:Amidohydrolase 3 domain-containing protein n=1 Tax=Desulfonispora thiosulfatigenes DSM 11270 TaxID=656914 RepID=A0A1W1V6A6_DESTI|nr:amidohydrolase [Desulfonispora thiosulfatigenes]SMB88843.1 hypothetical protein SAMN00017405_0541 [Desulfonispora thiosulfatigenes DSM 11270]